jgi:hypothetical protein
MEGRDDLGVLTQLRVLWECDLVAGLLLQRVGPDTGVVQDGVHPGCRLGDQILGGCLRLAQ